MKGLGRRTSAVVVHDDEADIGRSEQNRSWTTSLSAPGPDRERAARELYEYLLRAARSEFAGRSESRRLTGAERDDLTHQAAADAVLSVMRRLPDFRGDSRFTTWARSFVAFEVRTKIRQHDRRRTTLQMLTDGEWDRIPSTSPTAPDEEAEAAELKQAVMAAIATALTARQRRVFVSIVVEGSSIDQVASELGSNRNAIYQLMFHARRNLRHQLIERGLIHDPLTVC